MFIAFAVTSTTTKFPSFQHPTKNDGSLIFLVFGDWSKRVSFNQSQVALQMGQIGEKLDIDFIVSTGENFYENGLTEEHDTQHLRNHLPKSTLQKQWYSVLSNHDYRGAAEPCSQAY
ncbi:hypothetical protein SLA2020_289700 [Shorea laevis]